MRITPWIGAEPHRVQYPGYESRRGDDFGLFMIPHLRTNVTLKIIASSARMARNEGMAAWDHVSVSLPNRCPNWIEMEFIKRIFFADDECAMQLHVPTSDHISFHPFCLHIWRPADVEIPRPPSIMVAPSAQKEAS